MNTIAAINRHASKKAFLYTRNNLLSTEDTLYSLNYRPTNYKLTQFFQPMPQIRNGIQ